MPHTEPSEGLGSAVDLIGQVRSIWAPPPRLTVSEFADAELIVPIGPLEGTKWRTSTAPYQRGVVDAFEEPGVEHVAVMTSAQVGKTSLLLNLLAYHIAHDPCTALVVEPQKEDMAKDFSKNRLDVLIDRTPMLRDKVSKRREKGGSSTTYLKTFRGGMVAIAGANSASSLASRPIRLLLLDEIDRYPPELRGEGDTIAVAMKRTTAYRGRRRIVMSSSPTMRDAPIDTWYRRGDQRKYFVPCPECGDMHTYRWENVRWEDDDPATARLVCPSCDHAMDDVERVEQLAYGEWRPTAESKRPNLVSFHLWEAYSPFSSLAEIVTGFLEARKKQKAGDSAEMHAFQNTTLGEPVEDVEGEGVDAQPILLRREEYAASVPARACLLTAGVDTQDDRLEVLVVGWGPGEESWLIDHRDLWGDTSQDGPWKLLEEVLAHEYEHASGQRLPISAVGLDTAGHRTTEAYAFCLKLAARRVYACIGREGERPIVSAPAKPRRGPGARKVPLYTIGVDAAKALLMSRLKIERKDPDVPSPGYIHIPQQVWANEEFVAQLTSERLKTTWRSGRPKTRWVKTRTRNEALDLYVLATWALRRLRPDLGLVAERLADPAARPKTRKTERLNPVTGRPAGSYWRKR